MPRCVIFSLALLLGLTSCREDQNLASAPSDPMASSPAAAVDLTFRQVSAGREFTCGVAADQRAYCWGKNWNGQLGNGAAGFDLKGLTAQPVSGKLAFRQVSAGDTHACGVTLDSRAFCWGANNVGQLGDGTTTERTTPVAVKGGLRFQGVSAGLLGHTCGVTEPGRRVYCWGHNLLGQVGDGTSGNIRLSPVPIRSDRAFRQVATGYNFTCGVTTENQAYCWGWNRYGQLGTGTDHNRRARPTPVAGGLALRQLDVGLFHGCAVTTSSRAYCWGDGDQGRLGDGTMQERRAPVAVAGGLLFDRVKTGNAHTCGETSNNRLYCWGWNPFGQLGNGSTTAEPRPTRVQSDLRFTQVETGSFHTCAVAEGGSAYCWGENFYGSLGDGTTSNRLVPVAVSGG